jgi:hypothetical protein
MSSLENDPPVYPRSEYGPSVKEYVYDLRFEVVVKDGVNRVAVNGVFADFIKTMETAAGHSLLVEDTKLKNVDITKPIAADTFQERFSVETIEGKSRMVLLGFRLRTATPLSTLKDRMFEYLSKHQIFIRIHHGGFTNGLKRAFLGYLIKEHPSTANCNELLARINHDLTNFWKKSDLWAPDDRKKFQDDFPTVVDRLNVIQIPMVLEKSKHSTTNAAGKKISTDVLQILVHPKFAKPAKILLDGALLKMKSLPNFVPVGLRNENQDLYYSLLRDQAKWLFRHRNIQVHSVPLAHAPTVRKLLQCNNNIHRIYIDGPNSRLHISTTVDNFTSVREWITHQLNQAKFEFTPTIKNSKSSGTTNSPTRSIYTTAFQPTIAKTETSEQDSFDSTIKTTKSNAWNKPRSIPLTIDFSADADAFPPLPPKTTPTADQPTVTSKTTYDGTIRTEVASAVHDLKIEYEKKIEDLTNTMNEKILRLEQSLAKFSSMESKLDQLLSLVTTASTTSSTATPPRRAKRQDQKSTPTIARPSPDDSTAMHVDTFLDDDDFSATPSPIALEGRGS